MIKFLLLLAATFYPARRAEGIRIFPASPSTYPRSLRPPLNDPFQLFGPWLSAQLSSLTNKVPRRSDKSSKVSDSGSAVQQSGRRPGKASESIADRSIDLVPSEKESPPIPTALRGGERTSAAAGGGVPAAEEEVGGKQIQQSSWSYEMNLMGDPLGQLDRIMDQLEVEE